MNISCQTLPRVQRTQGIECFNLIQCFNSISPSFTLYFHPRTIWPKKTTFVNCQTKKLIFNIIVVTLFHIETSGEWLHPNMISYHVFQFGNLLNIGLR